MNFKDAPYYGDETNGYGTTLQIANNQMPPPISMDTTDYFNTQQATYQQQLAFEDETSYNNSQSNGNNPRVIREIIV